MKISISPKPILLPSPVIIVGTYGQDDAPNMMNAAWGGIVCSSPPCISISLREATLSYHNILLSKAFTVNIPSETYLKEADFVGIVSGKDQDKFSKTGLTPVKSSLVHAPIVKEFPYALACQLVHQVSLGTHMLFVGQIMDIVADEAILGQSKLPDIELVRPMLWGSFGSNAYYGIGEKLGDAFSVGRSL